jgi:hypothetical protein
MDTETKIQLIEVLTPLALAALGLLAARFERLVSARVKNERLRGVLLRLDDAVLSAVSEVDQVLVSGLKKRSADGVLTKAEREEAKAEALAALKRNLAASGRAELETVLGVDPEKIDAVLSGRLEAAVRTLRGA